MASDNEPTSDARRGAQIFDVTSFTRPFRYVNWGNYFLVLGGSGVTGGITDMFDARPTQLCSPKRRSASPDTAHGWAGGTSAH